MATYTPEQLELLEIWSTKYGLANLEEPEDFILQLKHLLANREGVLKSRHQAEEFAHTLVCWLITGVGCTDQETFEILAAFADSYSDQYKPWSPEYDHPVTNAEAKRATE
jgi:hypothetical protein